MGFLDDISDAGSLIVGGVPGAAANALTGGGFGSGVKNAWNWLSTNPGQKSAADDRALTGSALAGGNPYISANSPQQGNYNSLIAQLQQSASGQGPSLAGDAYNTAANNNLNQAMALSHGNSPGAARAALMQMGNINQGMANGYATARNQEIMGARGQLGGVVQAADQSQTARDKANQDAWLQILAQQLGLSRSMMGLQTPLQQIGPIVQGAGKAAGLGA